MRSSNKSRSRNKNNNRRNNNNPGNTINRVFDSAGPEGRVRGTPQQIIDKYRSLAHDAALGDDRVGAESFHQHAEHYARILSEAQREIAARQAEQQERQQQQRNQRQDDENNNRQNVNDADKNDDANTDNGIVATPEGSPQPPVRKKREPKPKEVTAVSEDQ